MAWYNDTKIQADVAISSRIRLARNVSPYPFVSKISGSESKKIIELCQIARSKSTWLSEDTEFIELGTLSGIQLQKMVEKNLISSDLFGKIENRGIIISKDETISIMLNEEDHIRIQCILSGLDLENAWHLADKVDNTIEDNVDYSFSSQLGYLTCCPSNLGTGMRASVMLHLPALSMLRRMGSILNAAGKIGITLRGVYGEGSDAVAYLYQVSNQITLGIPELAIIEKLKDIVEIIITKEKEARDSIMKFQGNYLRDKVCRSLGIMRSAVLMSSNEFMKLWSDVMLGINLGIIDSVTSKKLMETRILASPAHILDMYQDSDSSTNRDLIRASFIREQLKDKSEV